MVRMGTVWDRALDVLRGRVNIMVPIAVLAIFLPTVVSNAVAAYGQPAPGAGASGAASGLGAIVALVVLVAGIWGQLALLAIATDPATTREDAGRQATRRLGPALAVVIVLVVIFALLLLPAILPLIQAGLDMNNPQSMQSLPSGTASFVGLYFIVFLLAAIVVGARLILINPVILGERRGLGAISRSFQLTRGLTWRIVGVMLLFGVLLLIAMFAAQAVTALILRLILGGDALPTITFLSSTVGAVVSTALTVVAAAFTAQLYVAIAGKGARLADTFS